jgi:hypothetical protein
MATRDEAQGEPPVWNEKQESGGQLAPVFEAYPGCLGYGNIPSQILLVIVVLIPKGGGDYQGIGLLEPM